MRKFMNTLKELILLALLISFGSALIDYGRMSAGEKPVFCLKDYNAETKVETFTGILYKAERKVLDNTDERVLNSTNIHYHFLTFSLPMPTQFKYPKKSYSLTPTISNNCQGSSLYYADLNTKIYFYCVDSVDVLEKDSKEAISLKNYIKNNPSFPEIMVSDGSFFGLNNDQTTQQYHMNYTSTGIDIYRCQRTNINDIYIVPKGTSMQPDFCTYKNDDDDFIWYVSGSSNFSDVDELETIYEDDTYTYQIPVGRKDVISVIYPEVRGKSEKSIPITTVLENRTYSIEELIERGFIVLKKEKVDKE